MTDLIPATARRAEHLGCIPISLTRNAASLHRRVALLFAACVLANTAIPIAAQSVCLPAPRLLTTMPMGGQVGTTFDVTISGDSVDDASELVFLQPGITATAKQDAEGQPVPKQYTVTISEDCPIGIHEARVMTPLGLSSSRVFSVGDLPEVVQEKPSSSPETALPLNVNSICNAVMPVRAINHYRFQGQANQRIIVDCAARGIDSKLRPVVIIADAAGRDLLVERRGDVLDFTVPADGEYLIKVHELTFQGGPHFFYRLAIEELPAETPPTRLASTQAVNSFSWPPVGLAEQASLPEMEPNDTATAQRIDLPSDIAGSFYPAADVDVFEFTAQKGDVWWVEVASERLGLPTDPSILVQRIDATDGVENADSATAKTIVDLVELNDIASPVKVSGNNYAYDGPPYNAGSADILGKLEIPEDGLYRLTLLDLFGGTRNDPRNRYRMIIRKAAPDFAIVAWAMHMELRNGDRNALSKPMALRPGATMALEVVAVRRDGFDGDIQLSMDNLPDGVTAQGLKIPAGESYGIMLLTADEASPPGSRNATFVGSAEINGEVVQRPCRVASMAWPVKDAWSEIPSPRLLLDVPVSVGRAEMAPITILARSEDMLEVAAGQTLTIPLVHQRRGDFSGATMSVKTMGHGFSKLPKFDLPLTADQSEAVLDLAKLKTPPGEYWIAFYGSAVAKYSPQAFALDNEAKPTASDPAPTKDIVDIVVSKPIGIRVLPAEKP